MTPAATLAFCGAMFILAATPGPGVFAITAHALARGCRKTVPMILGIVAGDIIYLLFAVFGLSLLARTMGGLFTVIRLISGGYLIWLGIRLWRSAPRMDLISDKTAGAPGRTFCSGLLITLSNPKVILFYCSFLPTFLDLATLDGADISLIALLVALVLGSVLFGYSLAAGRAGRLFSSPRAMRGLNRTAGTVMAATGVAIATRT